MALGRAAHACQQIHRRYARRVSGQAYRRWRSRGARLAAVALLSLFCIGASAPLTLAASPPAKSGGRPGSAAKAATPEGANGNAFNELSQGSKQETQTQTQKTETSSTTSSTPTNSKKTILIIIAAALALLIAIAYVIVRDARGVAPASDPQLAEARSARDSAAILRKRRAKAKAARQARKRNR